MHLFWSSRSPYVRKVMVVAHEKGLAGQITVERVVVSGSRANASVMRHNPLSKIPTLVLENGTSLYDSRVICEYLDSIGHGETLFPSGETRWSALRRQALGDGLLDLLMLRLSERNRPEATRSKPHLEAYLAKTSAAFDRLEQEAETSNDEPVCIGTIAIACALCYADFRFADDGWRTSRPSLAAWYDAFSRRASMRTTEFSNEY